jgi:hypothetical protein
LCIDIVDRRRADLRGDAALHFPSPVQRLSATGIPSAPCLRINAFWAPENLEAFIALRSSQPGIAAENSIQKRSSFAVSEQRVGTHPPRVLRRGSQKPQGYATEGL